MLKARAEIRSEDVFCSDTKSSGLSSRTSLSDETVAASLDCASRYDKAVRSGDPGPLAANRNEIAALFNQGDQWPDRVLDGTGDIDFEIAVFANPEERARVLLDVPWELAADEQPLFRVARRLANRLSRAAPAFP